MSSAILVARTTSGLVAETCSTLKRLRDEIESRRPEIETKLNERTEWHWTIGQIFQHLHDAIVPYRAACEAQDHPPEADADRSVHYSWLGKQILSLMFNPDTPVPPQLEPPPPGPYGPDVIDRFGADHRWLIEFAHKLEGRDLSQLRFKNPFMSEFTMNGFDILAIGVTHAERHVAQVLRLSGLQSYGV